MNGYGRGFLALPPVVKNLILINILMLIATWTVQGVLGIDLTTILGLYFPKSDMFRPLQILTHMFMHANFWHLFFNMYALYIFGGILENVWGPKRFFIFYMICGLGAALTHETVIMFQYMKLMNSISSEQLQTVLSDGAAYLSQGQVFTNDVMKSLQMVLYIPTVGASGAIFGVLLAFGMLFPNTELMLLFPPIPIKAKWFVLGYGALELVLAVTQPGSNVAHAAHLGGMLFGYFLIKYWRKTTKTFY
ncbi:MAG: rhomboid family intramembrane serine protease [Bacteroidales bacterium]|jgi:membrane associated rhomboid family serine protease|nr:rhomboid family intramembrane serine protease [Bacteroidales bacterium]